MKQNLLITSLAIVQSVVILLNVTIKLHSNNHFYSNLFKHRLPINDMRDSKTPMSYLQNVDNLEFVKKQLLDLFEKKKVYLEPDIRIGDVAGMLLTNKSYLSKVIKYKTNKNFCQLVHYYRVNEAMHQFEANPDLTIYELGRLVGYKSMATFNNAFGRNTGYSPAEWCKLYLKKNMIICEKNSIKSKTRQKLQI
ncbi:MAG: AraC family transcriptional regulator [Bacteroidales bacterium]|nr:AraC family transcriptional regulator [Bacteroidales bacterium]